MLIMKYIDVIRQKIELLNRNIKYYRENNDFSIDTNNPNWIEIATRQSMEINSKFKTEICNLNNELISGWKSFCKQDILELQNILEISDALILQNIGIEISKLSKSNFNDALFFLLLKGKFTDYRDSLFFLRDIITFAKVNNINYKSSGQNLIMLFNEDEFLFYFKNTIEF